jgi:hypothetical protein
MLPCFFAVVEVPWAIAFSVIGWFMYGDPGPKGFQIFVFFLIVSLPSLIGLVWSVLALYLFTVNKSATRATLVWTWTSVITCSIMFVAVGVLIFVLGP